MSSRDLVPICDKLATQWRSQPKPDARASLIPHATKLNVEPTFMKGHAKCPIYLGMHACNNFKKCMQPWLYLHLLLFKQLLFTAADSH